ncbi:PREDICTED: uncharacterized protein LOC108621430 [Drosophila arizonae]|uniref:Uncharacterized protein LOC108621430 n=1 Tax=Drosophila arizonae TaxID=7263 RepID=A0ABM1Q434_DROAR|nr:PREDICTED: uncharacterized protein LOC108621430 [Drosophila arizonae]
MTCVGLCLGLCCILAVGLSQNGKTEDDQKLLFAVVSELHRELGIVNHLVFSGSQNNPLVQESLMESLNGSVILAGLEIGKLHYSVINSRNVAIAFFNGLGDPILGVVHNIFFNWCYTKHFHNTMLVMEHEIWTYEVKSTLKVFKFSPGSIREAIGLHICDQNRVQKPGSSVTLYQDFPDVYLYNSSNGIRLGGEVGILLATFMEKIKCSIDIRRVSFDEYMQRVSLGNTGNTHIDIGANMLSHFDGSLYSPVWKMTQLCLVLPNECRSFIEHFSDVYEAKLTVMFFMVIYTLLNALIMWIINPRAPLGNILFNSARLTIGQGVANRAFRRLRLPEKIIEMCTQIFTLLVLSIVTGAVTTALITGVRKPEIVDPETFLESGLRVMVYSNQVQDEFEYFLPSIAKRFLYVDKRERDRHLYALNDSYAYLMLTHKWQLLEYIQRRLHKPKLRLATGKLCSIERYIKLYVCSGACYAPALKHFALTAHEFGLTTGWMQQGLRQAEQAGLVAKQPYEPPTMRPLPLKFYQRAYALYGFILVLGLIAFLMECLIAYWRTHNARIVT